MTALAPKLRWQGCPCVPDVEGLHCQTCGIRLPAASRKRSIDTDGSGSLGSQQSDAGDCANSPGIVTRSPKEASDV